jgi:hypothetical protein
LSRVSVVRFSRKWKVASASCLLNDFNPVWCRNERTKFRSHYPRQSFAKRIVRKICADIKHPFPSRLRLTAWRFDISPAPTEASASAL